MLDFNTTETREEFEFLAGYAGKKLVNDLELTLIVISFNLFNPTMEIWMTTNLLIEIDAFG